MFACIVADILEGIFKSIFAVIFPSIFAGIVTFKGELTLQSIVYHEVLKIINKFVNQPLF